MTIKELYDKIGGNYQEALARFMSEDLLKMFLYKYFQSNSFEELSAAMDANDVGAAFEACHALKGLTLSMDFTVLKRDIVLLTEDLRAGKYDEETLHYWELVQKEYLQIKELTEKL